MSRPFFSICIPAYNSGTMIYETLSSIALQTDSSWQVVVADDGSTDETARICIEQDIIPADRYKFLRTSHSGLLDTRRELVEAADGEVIISLDADDTLCRSNVLERIHRLMDVTGCDFVMFNATRNLKTMDAFVDYSGLPVYGSGVVDINAARRIFSESYALNNIAFKAYRKGLIKIEKLDRPLQMTEDRLQSLQLFMNSTSCGLIDEPLYFYRPSNSSITKGGFDPAYVIDQLYVEDKVDELRSSFGLPTNDGDELLTLLLTQDLKFVREGTSSRAERLSDYQRIYDLWASSSRFHARLDPTTRIDRKITYRLFKRRAFSALDNHLGLFLQVKGLTRRGKSGEANGD